MKFWFRAFCLLSLIIVIMPFQFIYSTETIDQPVSQSSQSQYYKIAFISRRDGQFEIYVINADGSNEKRLTNNKVEDYYPTWSPDGSKMLYLSIKGRKNEIWVMNSDGSGQKRIAEDCDYNYIPAWSPDASKILFVAKRERKNGIFIVKLDNGDEVRLTEKEVNATSPSWSPDGSQILFVREIKKKNQICLMNSDGSNQVALTQDKKGCSDPFWSPDGKKIAYKIYPYLTKEDSQLFIMDCNGENQTYLVDTDSYENKYYPRRPVYLAPEKTVNWIPNGTDIAVVRRAGFSASGGKSHPYFSLVIVPSDGKGKEQSVVNVSKNGIHVPQWSSDGRKFVVLGKIYSKDPIKGFQKDDNIKIPVYSAECSVWSPDNSKIAFIGKLKYTAKSYIYLVNADGSGLIKLTDDSSAFYPVWAPNE